MFSRSSTLAMLAVAIGGASCSHSPRSRAEGELPAPVLWPAPPAAARVKLVRVVFELESGARRPWWRTALSWLAGVDEDQEGTGRLARPFDVAFEADGSFLVADPDRAAVVRYGREGIERGQLLCANHPWSSPMGIAVAADGAVFVTDGGDPSLVRWTASGCSVMGQKELTRPSGVAVAGSTVYVADPPEHRVVGFDASGVATARYGSRGGGDGQFNYPTDVAAAPDGSIYVVDALNFRVAHLGRDGSWLGAFGEAGETDAGLARPKGIHVDAAGAVYVSDAQRDRIAVFRPDGTLDYAIGSTGEAPGWLAHPAGIDVRNGLLLVADSQNRRVQVFEILGEAS